MQTYFVGDMWRPPIKNRNHGPRLILSMWKESGPGRTEKIIMVRYMNGKGKIRECTLLTLNVWRIGSRASRDGDPPPGEHYSYEACLI
jgi:hypothetical protein